MKKDEKSNEPSLIEKHALTRLNEVEQDKRRAYSKKDNNHSSQTIISVIILVIVIVLMLFSMTFS